MDARVIRYFAVFLALLIGCVPSKSAPVDSAAGGSLDASVTHEPEHFGTQGAVLTPLSYLQPPGVAGRKIIVSEDGGTWVAVDANLGGGGSIKGVDGGGIACDGSSCFITPACDAGFIVHYGGQWICEGVPFQPTLIAQDDASAGQVFAWNGSRWAPTTPAPIAIDAGTVNQLPETRLVACPSQYQVLTEGASNVACGSVNLASTNAVGTSKLPEINGGTGADLSSCTTGEPILAASGTFQCVSTLPVSSGGLGSAPTCVAGDLLMSSSPTVIGCVASSGDVSYAAGGAATVTSAQAGVLGFGSTGTITAASTATAPGLAQASESATQTPTPMTITPQASMHTGNQDGSELLIPLTAQLGTGADGKILMTRGGSNSFQVGGDANGHTCLWLDTSSPAFSNCDLRKVGGDLWMVSPGSVLVKPDGSNVATFNGGTGEVSVGFNFAVGVFTGGTYGGGTATEYLANGSATTGACTGGTCLGSVASTGLVATSAMFDRDTLQPVTSGTVATIPNVFPAWRVAGSSTTSVSVTKTMAIPTGPIFSVDIHERVVCTNSLGDCNASGVGASSTSDTFNVPIGNPTGTSVAYVGTPSPLNNTGGTSGGVGSLACVSSFSAGTLILTCGHSGNAATADWLVTVDIK